MEKTHVGIDISKGFFGVALPAEGGRYRHLQLSNDKAGLERLLEAIKGMEVVRVMEASGPCYLRLACSVHQQGVAVSVANPLSIRRFCQMRLSRAKTDKKDALMISECGKSEEPHSCGSPGQRIYRGSNNWRWCRKACKRPCTGISGSLRPSSTRHR